MNIYDTVLKGTQASKFILIEDSYLAKGQFLLKYIAENRKAHDVHVLCFQSLISDYQHLLPSLQNIFIHDCLVDTLSKNQCPRDVVNSIIKKTKKNIVLIIDSLSIYLLHTKFSTVYKEILDIISLSTEPKVVQTIAVIHDDVTETIKIEHLKNLCKTHIHVQSTDSPRVLNLKLEHKRSSGKCVVQKLKGEMKVDGNFKLIVDTPKIIEDDKSVPMNLASFKLVLEDSEKIAKDKLILPYTQVQNTKIGGTIHYIPDEADDWDEEDPDDDLEI
ncbi:elongator complex protein 5 [Adelges cooleyi]|uniref:elongator complex protein 5 n=1 Tax=Adelges cooleyi TaxID=133065 RepID=UPI00217F6106|nr:elongator complex protein 5 [Adelges cooleyi]